MKRRDITWGSNLLRNCLPTFCCFFRRWQPLVVSVSSFTCNSLHRTLSTFRFILQKKDLRAPGHSLDTPWGTSVFTGNIAETILNEYSSIFVLIERESEDRLWSRCCCDNRILFKRNFNKIHVIV